MNAEKKLYQRKTGAIVTGLCNGMANYFNVDATLVRICWVGFSLIAYPEAILAYAMFAFVVPYASDDEENACLLDMQKLQPLILRGDVRSISRHLQQVWNGLLCKWTGRSPAT